MIALTHVRVRASRSRLTGLIIMVLCITLGCAPTVVFYGDSALRAIIDDTREFRNSLEQAAVETGHRVALRWDPSPELATAWIDGQLAEANGVIVVLSPYFSLFASEFADSYSSVSFVGMVGSISERPNLTQIVFDRVPAMSEAGVVLRNWEESGPARKAATLFLTDTTDRRDELQAFEQSYGSAGSESLLIRRFSTPPDRTLVRSVVRDLLAEGANAFLVFIGVSNRFALELLQSETVVIATDAASGATSIEDALLFSIEMSLDVGMAAALRAINRGVEGGTITAESALKIGRGFFNPQLAATGSEDIGTDSPDEL